MRVKLGAIIVVLATVILMAASLKTKDIEYEQVTIHQYDMDIMGIRNYAGMFSEQPNVYFSIKDSKIIMYSNLVKSGFDEYSISNIKLKGKKLYININGNKNPKADAVNKELIIRIFTDQVPEKFVVKFFGKNIKNYEIIGE